MRGTTATLMIVALGIVALPMIAQAEEGVGFRGWGVRAGYQVDPDQPFFGAHADLGELVENLHFIPNVTIGFGDDATLLSISPDLSYWFPVEGVGSLYAGGLLAFQWFKYDLEVDLPGIDDTDTELGFHAITGLVLNEAPIFFEANIGIEDTPDFKLAVGYTFPY